MGFSTDSSFFFPPLIVLFTVNQMARLSAKSIDM